MNKIKQFATLIVALCTFTLFTSCQDDGLSDNVPVINVVVSTNSLGMLAGNIQTVEARVLPPTATNQGLTWTSIDPNIARVDENGQVTAVSIGSTRIAVTSNDRISATDTISVSVVSEGILLGNTVWALSNVDAPGTFADNPEDAGMFFQFGRNVGHPATGSIPWPWTAATGAQWNPDYDPCPDGWRIPTNDEIRSLADFPTEWTERNGISGRMFGAAPNQLFLPAAGNRTTAGVLGNAGIRAAFWSSQSLTANGTPWMFFIQEGQEGDDRPIVFGVNARLNGHFLRCVAGAK